MCVITRVGFIYNHWEFRGGWESSVRVRDGKKRRHDKIGRIRTAGGVPFANRALNTLYCCQCACANLGNAGNSPLSLNLASAFVSGEITLIIFYKINRWKVCGFIKTPDWIIINTLEWNTFIFTIQRRNRSPKKWVQSPQPESHSLTTRRWRRKKLSLLLTWKLQDYRTEKGKGSILQHFSRNVRNERCQLTIWMILFFRIYELNLNWKWIENKYFLWFLLNLSNSLLKTNPT